MIMCSPPYQSDSERDLTPFAPNPRVLEALQGGNRSKVVKQIRKERKYWLERIERGMWTEVAYPVSHCRRETVKEEKRHHGGSAGQSCSIIGGRLLRWDKDKKKLK